MLKGIGVSKGIGQATALCYVQRTAKIPAGPATDRAAEVAALRRAVDAAVEENQSLYQTARKRAGETEADIFAAHNVILEDEDSFFLPAQKLIADEGVNAAAAVARVLDEIAETMSAVEDAHLRERAADFRDVRDQVIRNILGPHSVDLGALEKNVILIAVELSPSDTIRMDAAHIAGIICQEGGKTSHTAILAKAMGIPAIMGCAGVLDQVRDGESILMDGASGEVVCTPDEACCREFKRRAAELETLRQQQEQYRGKESVTADGHKVEVCANIASPLECGAAVKQDCEGIGLFRSEFLFMDRDTLPDEEEQYEVYRKTLELAAGRVVTFRTLDAGGDKKLPLLTEHEENPFLGYRAIRICLAEPDLFKTQLRALYRASAYGRLRIMFPMISSIEELREAKQIAAKAREELKAEGVPFDEKIPVGIMVEIPATAVGADLFARECDFFSIGTNDLVQYTVAVDRGNKKIEHLYTHYHPAVLRLIQNTIRAAHDACIPCCMCGEAAGDTKFIPVLLGMGLDSFSMSAPGILNARSIICRQSFESCQTLAERSLACATAEEVRSLLA